MSKNSKKRKGLKRPENLANFTEPVELLPKGEAAAVPAPKLFWPVYVLNDLSLTKYQYDDFPGDQTMRQSFMDIKRWKLPEDTVSDWDVRDYIHFSDTKNEFWNCLLSGRISYIVDKKYSERELSLLSALLKSRKTRAEARRIVIFCGNMRQCSDLRNVKDSQTVHADIEIYSMEASHLEKSIHDRFVIIDGEIWHFGCTAGGIYPALTAYSRGWFDRDEKFRTYIEMMIKNQTP